MTSSVLCGSSKQNKRPNLFTGLDRCLIILHPRFDKQDLYSQQKVRIAAEAQPEKTTKYIAMLGHVRAKSCSWM